MKKIYIHFNNCLVICFLLTVLFNVQLIAQNSPERCNTVQHEEQLKLKDPQYAAKRQTYINQLAAIQNNNSTNRTTAQQITINIPVVVHVVYKNSVENISDAQILSQIDVLNEDFNFLNTDTLNIPSVFRNVAGNAGINFCLAQVDPNGNGTDGIERRAVTTTPQGDDVKHYNTGGLDAWDVSKYFNIWISNLGGSLFGYAEFPTNSYSNTYGVSINYTAFGRIGTLDSYSNKGRTASHEIGHCLNLYHIWGDTNCGNDGVADTPPARTSNYDCPTFPHNANNSCGAGANGEMFMNYMDYCSDNCLCMFTAGQVVNMRAVLTTYPYNSLATSNACVPLNIMVNDAGIKNIIIPAIPPCGTNTLIPQVELKNFGSAPLTAATIHYQIDNGNMNTYNWTGNLTTYAKTIVTLPNINTSLGTHTLQSYTTIPNGFSDENNLNDTTIISFNNGTVNSLPFTEGFESDIFPDNGFSIENPNNDLTWVRTTLAAKTGNASVVLNNATYSGGNGKKDDLILPLVNLTTANPTLSFDLAYTYWTSPLQWADTLAILLSTDCGNTYHSIYKKWGDNLKTAPAQANDFVPLASQWRNETIDLSSYNNATSVVIKFRNISDYENNLYIDNINISNSLATKRIDILTKDLIHIFPNPTNGQFTVTDLQENSTITVTNLIGQQIFKTATTNTKQLIDISSYNKGIYLVSVQNQANTSVCKLVLE